jgi:thymidylate synthase (FAD)
MCRFRERILMRDLEYPQVDIVAPVVSIPDLLNRERLNEWLQHIERCARLSHQSVQGTDPNKFLESIVLRHGDWSVIEHIQTTAFLLVDRGISHEIVRHRLGSYTQESTRFVNYNKKPLRFIAPENLIPETNLYRQFIKGLADVVDLYELMLVSGCVAQEARDILPTCTACTIAVTYNLRQWRHFLLMRTTKESHPKMYSVACMILSKFQQALPFYGDIIPNASQRDNLKRMR